MKITIIFLILGLLLFITGVAFHEQVHVEIYKSYGIESKVEYFSHFPRVVTIAESPCPTETCTAQHGLNEVVSYNSYPFFGLLFFGFAGIISVLEGKRK